MNTERFKYFSIKLNQEIHFASEYLYNGYIEFIDIDNVMFSENNLAMIFINLSMGIERLMKTLLLLSNEIIFEDEHDIENTLDDNTGHDLSYFNYKISRQTDIDFNRKEKLVLSMLSEIYVHERYSNINYESEIGNQINKINRKLKRLSLPEISNNDINGIDFPSITKESILKKTDLIINQLIRKITEFSKKLHIFTNETESYSKFYVFNFNENSSEYFYRRKLAIKELLIYISYSNKSKDEPFIEPLNLDDALISNYFESLINKENLSGLIDEVENEYVEVYDETLEEYEDNFKNCYEVVEEIIRDTIINNTEPKNHIAERIYKIYNIPLRYLFTDFFD